MNLKEKKLLALSLSSSSQLAVLRLPRVLSLPSVYSTPGYPSLGWVIAAKMVGLALLRQISLQGLAIRSNARAICMLRTGKRNYGMGQCVVTAFTF